MSKSVKVELKPTPFALTQNLINTPATVCSETLLKLRRCSKVLLVQLRGCGESKGSGIAHVALETVLEILLAKVREFEILEIVEVDVNILFVELYMARCGKHRCKSVEGRAQEDQNGQKSVSLHSKDTSLEKAMESIWTRWELD